MGYSYGLANTFLLSLFFYAVILMGLISNLVFFIFRFTGLSKFIRPDPTWSENPIEEPDFYKTLYNSLMKEILPVFNYDNDTEDQLPENQRSCCICLEEYKRGEEMRGFATCKHVFHRPCMDSWIEHEQITCPLCRTPFETEMMKRELNRRLWAATGFDHFHSVDSRGVVTVI